MSDLISRADAIEAIASRDETDGTVKAFTGREVNGILSALPSADTVATFRTGQTYGKSTSIRELVEVVHCKECKHCRWDGFASKICRLTDMTVEDECYCWWGERRNHETD